MFVFARSAIFGASVCYHARVRYYNQINQGSEIQMVQCANDSHSNHSLWSSFYGRYVNEMGCTECN